MRSFNMNTKKQETHLDWLVPLVMRVQLAIKKVGLLYAFEKYMQ